MTLCPIAAVAGCRKCPVFSICPLKGVIGDQKKASDAKSEPTTAGPGAKAGGKPSPTPDNGQRAKRGARSGAKRGKRG